MLNTFALFAGDRGPALAASSLTTPRRWFAVRQFGGDFLLLTVDLFLFLLQLADCPLIIPRYLSELALDLTGLVHQFLPLLQQFSDLRRDFRMPAFTFPPRSAVAHGGRVRLAFPLSWDGRFLPILREARIGAGPMRAARATAARERFHELAITPIVVPPSSRVARDRTQAVERTEIAQTHSALLHAMMFVSA